MQDTIVHTRQDCRLCGSTDLVEVLSFGETPLANAYLSSDELDKPEIFAPLTVALCNTCKLVQLRDVVDPKVLFSKYLYVSGTSPSFVAHFAAYAKTIVERFTIAKDSLVVDFGSNDGTLLQQFKNEGMRVLGIDPAENLAEEATRSGIPTIAAFFTPEVTRPLALEYGPAAVVTSNNAYGHIDDVRGATEAVKTMLAPEGIFVFEVQYLKDLVEQNLFDMVYHEHLCYFHVAPLVPFFRSLGLRLFDVEHVPTHGGSIRVYVCHDSASYQTSPRVAEFVESESGLNDISTYRAFASRIQAAGKRLRAMLEEYKKAGKRIAGFGAPAKATTLCYAYGLDQAVIDFIVDDAALKQGRFMPGTHIPILASDALYQKKPDVCIILAWNFAEPIMHNHEGFKKNGGIFIVPVPEPRIA